MRGFGYGLLFATAALVWACASLRPIAADQCGNGVIDPGEDCDGFPVGEGTVCRSSGTVGACRLDCSSGVDGGRPACPTGWGCGTDGLCRQPSGRFALVGEPVSAGAWRLQAGDFDGDGRADVLTRDRAGADGRSKLRAHFLDPSGNVATTLAIAGALATPAVRDVTGDGRADITFGTFRGLGVLVGSSRRELVAAAYPTFSLPDHQVRPIVVTGFTPGSSTQDVLFFVGSPTFTGLVHLETTGAPPTVLTTTTAGPAELVSDPATGRFHEQAGFPCEDAAWAFDGATSVLVYPLCLQNGAAPSWNTAGSGKVEVTLPAGTKLEKAVGGGVKVGDVNADGHQDLLIGVGNRTFVAFGDGQGNFREKPTAGDPGAPNRAAQIFLPREGGPSPIALPLAVGDLNADGMADYALAREVVVSTSTPAGIRYRSVATKDKGAWDVAVFGDFNANGLVDVVAGSSTELDLTFLNGAGGGNLNPFTIATTGPVEHFAVGDVDGDLLPDLAFAVTGAGGTEALAIAWGRLGAPLSAASTVGQFEGIVGLVTVDSGRGLRDLFVAFEPKTPPLGAVAVLAGSGDRQPLAPLRLPEASTSVPFVTVAGTFSKGATPDVAAVARFDPSPRPDGLPEEPTALWLGKSQGPAQFVTPARGQLFPEDLVPSLTFRAAQRNAVVGATGDVDGDGVEEIVLAAPQGVSDGSRGALFVARVRQNGDALTLDVDATTVMPLPFLLSQEGRLAVADVDGDGAQDVVLLTGSIDNRGVSVDRRLLVFWNEGGGRFRVASSLALAADGEKPEDFTFVRERAAALPSLAYVTGASVVVLRTNGRSVEERRVVYEAGRKVQGEDAQAVLTGIAAGDYDGDGIDDLALAELGNLVVLRGEAVLR